MKKYVLGIATLGLLTVAPQLVNAQNNVRFGVKGGLNLSHATHTIENPISNVTTKHGYFGPGFYAGGLMEYSFPRGSKWKLQAEALFNYHSLKSKDFDVNMRVGAVSIPVLVKYFPKPNFSLMAGVAANINVLGKGVNKTLDVVSDINNLNTFQPGLLFGLNYYVKGGFFLDARYTYNLGNVMEMPTDNNHFRYGQFSLGIGYKFK